MKSFIYTECYSKVQSYFCILLLCIFYYFSTIVVGSTQEDVPNLVLPKINLTQANILSEIKEINVKEIKIKYRAFRLTKQSYDKLKNRVPKDIVSQINSLKKQLYTNENDFVKAIEKAIGSEQTVKYKSVILKHAEDRTLFSKEEVNKMAEIVSHEGKITQAKLWDIRDALTSYCKKRGYINSRATIPHQGVVNGVIDIHIIVGVLNKIDVQGPFQLTGRSYDKLKEDGVSEDILRQLKELKNKLHKREKTFIEAIEQAIGPEQTAKYKSAILKRSKNTKYFEKSFIEKRLRIAAGPPLNLKSLREALQLLQHHPGIKTIEAKLTPDIEPNKANLNVTVYEEKPCTLRVGANNNHSPSVGAEQGEIYGSYMNLIGVGDTFYGRYGKTEGLDEIDVSYILPLTAYTLPLIEYEPALKINFSTDQSTVITTPFDDIDIESETDTYGITLSQPICRKPNREFSLSLGFERRKTETFLMGHHFSFSPGAEHGETDISVFRFKKSLLEIDSNNNQAFFVNSTVSLGVDAFGSTVNGSARDGTSLPDSQFFTWQANFQWRREFWPDGLLLLPDGLISVFRTDLQLSADTLLPVEKFSIGGMYTVRGYRENQLVRDNGLVSSLELRFPVRYDPRDWELQLAVFGDYGRSWNTDIDTFGIKGISSVGAGVRGRFSDTFNFQVYIANHFRKFYNNDHDLQDEGIHFRFSYKLF